MLSFHGYAWYSGDWSDKFALAAAGFVVAAMDVRGQNGYSKVKVLQEHFNLFVLKMRNLWYI
ncbi:acetylxylan esterase [Caldicellulosiruptor morganii]|uniref:Acetylxylan esterase n=1 Tax=Caldicellulosiruptor morganii TaxID=1387555 RepID=A0ABY7BLQ4_9FIRM|nr:acetylxylan esterase [Caldicellulosiruptor morganii]